jgi:hypothetical protein
MDELHFIKPAGKSLTGSLKQHKKESSKIENQQEFMGEAG